MGWSQGVSFPIVVNKSKKQIKLGSSTALNPSDCEVIGFSDVWWGKRKFPIDMAGFAVNLDFLSSRPRHEMPFKVAMEEDGFLQSMNIKMSDFEPMADCGTQVYVWHTKTKGFEQQPVVRYNSETSSQNKPSLRNSNIQSLIHRLQWQGVLKIKRWQGQAINICTNKSGCT